MGDGGDIGIYAKEWNLRSNCRFSYMASGDVRRGPARLDWTADDTRRLQPFQAQADVIALELGHQVR